MLGQRRFVSRAWICCRLAFKDRHRGVWGRGYTELFFLDEVTALAAGHRPCFECRRADARVFAAAWAAAFGLGAPPRAAQMDEALDGERRDGRTKRRHRARIEDLPDGAMIALSDAPDLALAISGERLLPWTPTGYAGPEARCRGLADVLTPPSIIAVLAAGYAPRWHGSAGISAAEGTPGR
jgi:hypothetical protein